MTMSTELEARNLPQISADTIFKNVQTLKFEIDLELAIIYECLPDVTKEKYGESEVALQIVGRRLCPKPKSLLEKIQRVVLGKHMRFLCIEISDSLSNPICTIERPVPRSFWLGWFFTHGKLGNKMVIKDKDGNIMAFIKQKMKLYHVVDAKGIVLLEVKHRKGSGSCCGTKAVFSVTYRANSPVATIVKLHGGAFQEILTHFRCFSINFEGEDIDWMLKLLTVACVFQLHFVHFERGKWFC